MSGSLTNAGLTSITKIIDFNSGAGNGSSFSLVTGLRAVAGSIGASTGTWSASVSSAMVTLALQPPTPVIVVTSVPVLDLRPEQSGYSVNLQNSNIDLALEGGPSKKRGDVLFAPHTVTATWTLKTEEYSPFMGFFRTTLADGAIPFLLNLVTDIGLPTLHKCRTIGGIPRLTKQEGQAYYTSCTLEVQQNPTFTGLISYAGNGTITFTADNPKIITAYKPGDTVRILDSKGIYPTGSTPLNLDGVYTVNTVPSTNVMTLLSPSLVTSDWTTLLGLGGAYGDAANGNVISTITRVPT